MVDKLGGGWCEQRSKRVVVVEEEDVVSEVCCGSLILKLASH